MQQPEPSVLDYLKSLLPWNRQQVHVPAPARQPEPVAVVAEEGPTELAIAAPWRSLLALCSALSGQILFEPPRGATTMGIAFYILALALLVWAIVRDEWTLAPQAESIAGNDPLNEYLHQTALKFEDLQNRIEEQVIAAFGNLQPDVNGKWPELPRFDRGATWTYVINDQPFGNMSERFMKGLIQRIRQVIS